MAPTSQQSIRKFFNKPQEQSSSSAVKERVKSHLSNKMLNRRDQFQKNQTPLVTSPETEGVTAHQKLDKILSILEKNDTRVGNIEAQLSCHNENLINVDFRLNELEQAKVNTKMEISGLTLPQDTQRYQIKGIVSKFLSDAGISFNEMEIVDAYAMSRRFRQTVQNYIVVTFLHEAIKNRVMSEKIRLDKNKTVTVFFGHVLTRLNHSLLMKARYAVKGKKLIKAWSMSGNIFVLKSNDEGKIKLISHEHLEYLISNDTNVKNDPNQMSSQMEVTQSYSDVLQSENDDPSIAENNSNTE